jgi:hypothetical protein
MVVSTVRFRDGDELRPVLYEGHLSEIFVPYMDPATAWYTRNYLDLVHHRGLAGTMEPHRLPRLRRLVQPGHHPAMAGRTTYHA